MVETRPQGRSKFRNVCRIVVVSNAQKEEKWRFLKDALLCGASPGQGDALWGGGTHRSWPGGRGGRPRLDSRGGWEGLAWWGKLGQYPPVDGGFREAGQGLGGGCKGFGSGGVSGRGTGPRDGANFATCVDFCFSNAYKKRKMAFFEGRGVPTGAGLVDGGVDQGP